MGNGPSEELCKERLLATPVATYRSDEAALIRSKAIQLNDRIAQFNNKNAELKARGYTGCTMQAYADLAAEKSIIVAHKRALMAEKTSFEAAYKKA